jgi:hypothetical protein
LLTENEKEYGKGRLKYKEQKTTAWIGGAMDILDEEGDIVVKPNNIYRYLSTGFFFFLLCTVLGLQLCLMF